MEMKKLISEIPEIIIYPSIENKSGISLNMKNPYTAGCFLLTDRTLYTKCTTDRTKILIS